MIIPEKKLVFVHVAKCAGTSVEAALIERVLGFDVENGMTPDQREKYCVFKNSNQHWPAKKILEKRPETKEYTWVALVRDPVDRAISEFSYQLRQPWIKTPEYYAEGDISKALCSGDIWRLKPPWHGASATTMVEGVDVEVFRMEDQLGEFGDRLTQLTGVEIKLPHKNKSPRDVKTLSKPALCKLIDRWGHDFANFGYKLPAGEGKVGVVTMVLPRIELDHVAEWLENMAQVGVSKAWIYIDSTPDNQGFEGGDEKTWAKKPEARYHLESTDEQVTRKFKQVASSVKGIDVEFCEVPNKGRGQISAKQVRCVTDNFNNIRRGKTDWVDWCVFIDVDELLCAKGGIQDHLDKYGANVASVSMSQKVMGGRWANGEPIPMKSVTDCYSKGAIRFNMKKIDRMLLNQGAGDIHAAHNKAVGDIQHANKDELFFCHFRGKPTKLPLDTPDAKRFFPGVSWYASIYENIPTTDKSHLNPTQ